MSLGFFLKKSFYKLININIKKNNYEKIIVIKSENKNWVLNEIAQEYKQVFSKFSNKVSLNERNIFLSSNINLFIMSKYHAIKNLHNYENQIYFPYFHGLDIKNINIMKKNLSSISKIQTTHSLVENFFLDNGIPNEKFKRIPITIDISKFDKLNLVDKNLLKKKYEIPLDSFVIGSFQKDGDGWGEGNIPKLIKGPDIFLKTVKILKDKIPELFVLLSGPSRGYVKKGLQKIKVRYKHLNFLNYNDLIKLYKCLNVYLICSREEGGPRAIMESFASKTPLVTTNVGQAIDMIKNETNAFKIENFDEEMLADFIFSKVYNEDRKLEQIIENGYNTVKNHSYNNQVQIWKEFFNFEEKNYK
tara:strand:+ start:3239 stop:4318 length:1080 start_codon:yes stop_codon:yes gene_type:complete